MLEVGTCELFNAYCYGNTLIELFDSRDVLVQFNDQHCGNCAYLAYTYSTTATRRRLLAPDSGDFYAVISCVTPGCGASSAYKISSTNVTRRTLSDEGRATNQVLTMVLGVSVSGTVVLIGVAVFITLTTLEIKKARAAKRAQQNQGTAQPKPYKNAPLML